MREHDPLRAADRRAVWWPVAFSSAVTTRPMAVACGEIDAVVFRDHDGIVRAFIDRCVHRRAALSMGWLAPDGTLQCRYHGWCYDVRTGACVDIPTYQRDVSRPDNSAAARFTLQRFAAAERCGVVFVCVDATPGIEPQLALPWDDLPDHRLAEGTTRLAMTHTVFVEALLTQPELVLRLEDPLLELVLEKEPRVVTTNFAGDTVIVERYAQRKIPKVNFENPRSLLLLRTETQRVTGLTRLTLRQEGGAVEIEMLIGSRPILPYATEILWRVTQSHGLGSVAIMTWRLRRNPVTVRLSAARSIPSFGFMRTPRDLWQRMNSSETIVASDIEPAHAPAARSP